MLKTVLVAEDCFDPSTWETVEVPDLCEYLTRRFTRWPKTARLYHQHVAQSHDITPTDAEDIERLRTLEGRFYVVVYPADAVTVVVAIVAVVAAIAAAYFFRPEIPNIETVPPNQLVNNALSERKNTARLKERIPDIFGQVRSTPDLLAVPYRFYRDNIEFEHSYLCIGRGTFDVSDVREDKTKISDILGEVVRIYGPNTSPNYGTPQAVFGDDLVPAESITSIVRHSSVDQDILRPPNINFPTLDYYEIGLAYPNDSDYTYPAFLWTYNNTTGEAKIKLRVPAGESFLDYFQVGGELQIVDTLINITWWDGVNRPSASGGQTNSDRTLDYTYTLTGVTRDELTFIVPDVQVATSYYPTTFYSLRANWNGIINQSPTPNYGTPLGNALYAFHNHFYLLNGNLPRRGTPPTTPRPYLTASGNKYVGPFVFDHTTTTKIAANFVAPNGLYKESGTTRTAVAVEIRLDYTQVQSDGITPVPGGSSGYVTATLTGSSSRIVTQRAATLETPTVNAGRYRISAYRVTNSPAGAPESFSGIVVDNVYWQDLYAVTPYSGQHFGDVTTLQAITRSVSGSQNVTRKLNCLVTRMIPTRLYGTTFGSNTATSRVDDIITFICQDSHIGNRQLSELDLDNIYNAVAEVETYFGHSNAVQFSHSFDSADISFEEILSSIANAVFCLAYRRGSLIKMSFEKATADSVLLFNHRNKIPGTETRTARFGILNDNDGVEFGYVDPVDDQKVVFYLPSDMSAIRPKRVESVGIRSKFQAYMHAYRIWNKIRYQAITTEFEATQEADLLLLNDRFLNADNTRPETLDGEIVTQNVLVLTLSQEVDLSDGDYIIFLQHTDGSVEQIGLVGSTTITTGVNDALDLDSVDEGTSTVFIAPGTYTRAQLATAMGNALQNAYLNRLSSVVLQANNIIRVTFNDGGIGDTIRLLGATGAFHARSAYPSCGFAAVNTGWGLVFDGANPPPVVSGTGPSRTVQLIQAPRLALNLADDAFARTTYILTKATDARTASPFLLVEKESQGKLTSRLKAVNYDDRYYQNDDDYTTGVIDANGNVL